MCVTTDGLYWRMDLLATTELSRPGVPATSIYRRGGSNRKHRLEEFSYCCYGRLPSDSSDMVDVFTGRYQVTHVPLRDHCTATILYATLS